MKTDLRALLAGPLLASLALACAHSMSVTPPSPAPSTSQLRARLPVVIEYVGVRFDGLAGKVSNQLLERISAGLREAEFFPRVFGPAEALEAPEGSLWLALSIVQSENLENPLLALLKGTLAAASLLLLDPLLPIHYGFTVELDATLSTGNWERRYQTEASGTARYSMFLSNPWRAGHDTRAAVMARALELLIREVTSDAELAARGGIANLGRHSRAGRCPPG